MIIILLKFIIKEENININLSNLIGPSFNESINFYIRKLIQLNQKTSIIYILHYINSFINRIRIQQ